MRTKCPLSCALACSLLALTLALAGCGGGDDSTLVEAQAASQAAADVASEIAGRHEALADSLTLAEGELEAMPEGAAGRAEALETIESLRSRLEALGAELERANEIAQALNDRVQALESGADVAGLVIETAGEIGVEHAPADWRPWIALATAVAGGVAAEVGRRREKRVSSGVIRSIDASRVGSGADGTIVLDSARLRTEQVSKGIRETVKARRKKAAG